jgi:hypothetical protein
MEIAMMVILVVMALAMGYVVYTQYQFTLTP